MVKQLDPQGVAARRGDLQRHRGKYVVPGPNFIWSIDGYMKLVNYGIEVYAVMDAYSRKIIPAYVGLSSSRTAISVSKQSFTHLREGQRLPRNIRSDRGTETGMLAAAQYTFRKAEDPESSFAKCHLYGTSTTN